MTDGGTASAAAVLLLWIARDAARRPGQPAGHQGITATMSAQEWTEFLREALRHGMLPAAARALADEDSVPSSIAEDLRQAEVSNARRSLTMLGQLLSTLRDLEAAGIRAVPWKGPLLAQRAYGDVGRRYFFDLDVLVRPAQMRAARDVLLDRGFRTEKPMTDAQQNAYVDHQGELEMVRDSDGMWLELHTAVVPNYYSRGRSSDDLWSRIVRATLGRDEVWALDPADEVEALCVHGSKHRWERLAWILDIAMMSRLLSSADFKSLTRAAREHGTLRMVRLGMILAADLAEAELPDEVLAEVRADRTAMRLAAEVRSELFDPRDHLADGLFFHAQMLERPRDRWVYLANVVFRPSGADWESVAVPRALFPVYAVTRPLRLSLKYGGRLLRRGRSTDDRYDRARNDRGRG